LAVMQGDRLLPLDSGGDRGVGEFTLHVLGFLRSMRI
jgi:hypothetical protein